MKILKHHGYDCINVSGGYQMWKVHAEKKFAAK